MTAKILRWGIIGPGAIARDFRRGVLDSRFGKLEAIATRDPSRPGLAEQFPEARILEGYDAILADPDVDAVYIATPHVSHVQWAIRAAEAGKHVLVEKPFALSAFEADAVFNAHRKAGTFAGEAFMYRLHPQTKKLHELIASGVIGEVRAIKSSFGFQMPGHVAGHRLFASELAGGGILDVGGYPVSMSRLVAGAASGKPFLDPVRVAGMATLNEEGTDNWAAALLQFENGIIAEVSCGVLVNQENVLRIIGSEGRIEVPNFWFADGDRAGGEGRIDITRDGVTETVRTGKQRHLYSFEADAAAEAIFAGRQEFEAPGMSWADTLGNARVLDKWRADAGIEFSVETPAGRPTTLSGRALSRGSTIPRRRLPGLGKEVSTLALGFEDFRTFASAAILLDAFYEAGGNVFDTAWIYGGGVPEALLGAWLETRGVREDAVVIAKGAHSPLCYPETVATQLAQTLDRLQTDYVDVYFLHRDNPDIPVGEFVDALDAEVRAGRIRGLVGGSNWTRERFDAALDYAERHGRQKLGALSNNFALAQMQDPVWAGCVSASDAQWKDWLRERQVPNFAWSSQARGFFTASAGRELRVNPDLVRSWYSEANFARRDRAVELARELGKNPIHIALAYVLAQPFPVLPIIGPRRLDELDDSLSALDVKLSPEQVRWLEG